MNFLRVLAFSFLLFLGLFLVKTTQNTANLRAVASSDSEITFLRGGKPFKVFTLSEIRKITPTTRVQIEEPHEKEKKTYQALDFQKVLKSVYGSSWKKAKTVTATCLDGFQPVIQIKDILKHRPYLAFGEAGKKAFQIKKPTEGDKVVELGPLYLIWDNVTDPKVKKLSLINWPYQTTQFDLK